ncbi:Mvp17/PMP22 family protein 1 [Schizosaccharomyces japonicus yFS275]|uniref:Mvp17/PMP22 family protein 1 n=1 Tax=Schizosaccharomyces japonicus (strain yFS275 / FY16936) TaxID=402676 RepID=B6JYI8_SCHJY|nr:Mvp17/PMP22 family protein 1 [Schizosaccharomyces japonicus yFS275]EEB06606.2 Mvp17/PMP22 family protein 1 [Schizosaccharomyces japonicus yFS275]
MFRSFSARYNQWYQRSPVLTMCFTAATLAGISDGLAQGLTIYRARKNAITGLGGEKLRAHPELPSIRRVLQFVGFGFAISPIQFRWLRFLAQKLPVSKGVGNVVSRVLLDQIVFAPFGLSAFYTWMTLTEGNTLREAKRRLQNVLLPTLKANYSVWPFVQAVNFWFMPLQYQLPFSSIVSLFWNMFLSIMNASESEEITQLGEIELV